VVRRVSGALPPLTGVKKRIAGRRGETVIVGGPGIPFEVHGLELHRRTPAARDARQRLRLVAGNRRRAGGGCVDDRRVHLEDVLALQVDRFVARRIRQDGIAAYQAAS
jgi:hypothetical protein